MRLFWLLARIVILGICTILAVIFVVGFYSILAKGEFM